MALNTQEALSDPLFWIVETAGAIIASSRTLARVRKQALFSTYPITLCKALSRETTAPKVGRWSIFITSQWITRHLNRSNKSISESIRSIKMSSSYRRQSKIKVHTYCKMGKWHRRLCSFTKMDSKKRFNLIAWRKKNSSTMGSSLLVRWSFIMQMYPNTTRLQLLMKRVQWMNQNVNVHQPSRL